MDVVNKMDFVGLMAVELFLDREVPCMWINELAPRTHNSGHNTIEGNVCSQFEQHLRAVLNLPLGDTAPLHPCSAMVNLIGSPRRPWPPVYEGMEEVLDCPTCTCISTGSRPSSLTAKWATSPSPGTTWHPSNATC